MSTVSCWMMPSNTHPKILWRYHACRVSWAHPLRGRHHGTLYSQHNNEEWRSSCQHHCLNYPGLPTKERSEEEDPEHLVISQKTSEKGKKKKKKSKSQLCQHKAGLKKRMLPKSIYPNWFTLFHCNGKKVNGNNMETRIWQLGKVFCHWAPPSPNTTA